MKQQIVQVRRLWHKNAFGIWLGESDGFEHRFFKPVKLEIDENSKEGYFLQSPTLELPTDQTEKFLKQLTEELRMQGSTAVDPHYLVKAKDENLNDLRSLNNRLLGILEKGMP